MLCGVLDFGAQEFSVPLCGINSYPILLSHIDGCKDCPSAIEKWTQEV